MRLTLSWGIMPLLLPLLLCPVAAEDVRLGNTPLAGPVMVVGGSGFEAAGAVVCAGDCSAPHFIVRAREQYDYWDVLLTPGKAVSTQRDYPVGPLPLNGAYVTDRNENLPQVNVSVGGYDGNVVSLPDGTVLVQTGWATWADNVGAHPSWWGKDYPSNDPTTVRIAPRQGQRDQELGELVDPPGQGRRPVAPLGLVPKQLLKIMLDHSHAGTGGGDHGFSPVEDLQEMAGQLTGLFSVAALVKGLAAAGLAGGIVHPRSGPGQDPGRGLTHRGIELLHQAGNEQADLHGFLPLTIEAPRS